MSGDVRPEDFPAIATDKLRFADTDSLGHVNNAVFSTFLETGRVEMLHGAATGLPEPGAVFVIARLVLDYRGEINYPGSVVIGTRVSSVGRSSVRMEHAIFQDERCVATAETVVVQMNEASRKSQPFSETARERLDALGGVR
ncbi:MAG: acyl-CoA thioesterase [Acetobacteraceae bacterium]|nr:acyl-CoA thioesterase [Acetobacteraceae bacterium]